MNLFGVDDVQIFKDMVGLFLKSLSYLNKV